MLQLFNYWQDVFWGGQGEADGKEQVARSKEKKGGSNSSTIGKKSPGGGQARLMGGGQGARNKEQGASSSSTIGNYIAVLAPLLYASAPTGRAATKTPQRGIIP